MAKKLANGAGADTGRNTGTVLTTGDVVPSHGGLLRPPWKPGQSGDPAGLITAAYAEARRICAEASPEAPASRSTSWPATMSAWRSWPPRLS
jgi:hypothetical protein